MIAMGVTLGAQWRDSLGRFATAPVAGSVGASFHSLGQEALGSLAAATPVKTGALRAGWTSSYRPSALQLRVTNRMAYWTYVTFGTSRQPANAALQDVITRRLPALLEVSGSAALQQITLSLKGG